MFEKSLTDLVRGIRSNKKSESVYIGQCLAEIKEEVKSNDPQKKANAVLKLVYLQMFGYEMTWAAFNVIEVMSQTKFTTKRIGYLAASQSFTQDTEVIMLATHLIRKDMTSSNIYDAGLAIDCLSNICTPDLARDLAADVVSMLNSSRPYIRKKACLVLYKIFLKFPDALRPSFPRLKEKLEDPDPAVQSAAVNVICELARKNPKNYIGLSPTLFKILTSSSNNWMLIKIIKLFGNLLPIEQRLAKKLIGPLTNLINTTPAMSLLYECIQTCTIGLSDHVPTIKLCISKLRTFVEDPDQNLKYLGLVALNNIMKIHPKAVAEHRDLVLNCLDDDDTTIRMRALDLLEGMVSKKNLLEIVRKLVDHIERTENGIYKDALVEKIVLICSGNSYQSLTDFEWYISVLMELSRTQGTKHGTLLASQFMDVIIRVPSIRPYGVKNMVSLLRDSKLLSENPVEGGNCEVLYAAAWIVGEFSSFVSDPLSVVEALLQPGVTIQPAHIQGVYLQAVLKLFALAASGGGSQASKVNLLGEEDATPAAPSKANLKREEIAKLMQARLPLFTQSQYLEVQERACFVQQVLAMYTELSATGVEIGREIASLFEEPLNPVGPKAQKKVKVPEGLDLDEWINEPPEIEKSEFDNANDFGFLKDEGTDSGFEKADPAEEERRREANKQRYLNNPHYLPSGPNKPAKKGSGSDVDDIPMERLTKEQLQGATRDTSSPFYLGGIKAPKKQKQAVTVLKYEEMPEGAQSDSESEKEGDDGLRADINWDEPVAELPKQQHHVVKSAPQAKKERAKKPRKEHKSKEPGEKKKGRKKAQPGAEAPSGGSLIDLGGFDPISSPAPPRAEEPATQPSFESIASPEEKRKPHRKARKSGAPTKKSKEGTKKASSKQKAPKEQPAPAQQQSPAPARPVSRFKPLCSDDTLSVLYELRVNPNEPKKFLCALAMKNRSQLPVSSVQFDVKGTLNTKISGASPSKADFTLEPEQAETHNVLFDVQNIEQPQKLSGAISYAAGENAANKDFQLNLPCSSFIIPVKLAVEEFFGVLRSGPLALAGCDVRAEGDFKSFIVNLAVLLRVELITMDEKGAALYGKSIQGHHVAIYVKVPPQGALTHVDVKSTSSPLAVSLANEVNLAFPK